MSRAKAQKPPGTALKRPRAIDEDYSRGFSEVDRALSKWLLDRGLIPENYCWTKSSQKPELDYQLED